MPERRDRVDQPVDRRADERVVPLFELRGAERLGDEVAIRAVLVAVHPDDELAHELPDVFVVDRRRERLVVAQHRFGVVVAGDLIAVGRPTAIMSPTLATGHSALRIAAQLA